MSSPNKGWRCSRSVLRSERAVQVNIAIMRAFVQLRELAASTRELARRLDDLEKKVVGYDQAIVSVFDAMRQLTETAKPAPQRRKIGFEPEGEGTQS
jgi:hypothetical protein